MILIYLFSGNFNSSSIFLFTKIKKDFTTALNSLISHQQFQLISKLMSKVSEFDGHELIELFKLGDKFLATGQAKENILSLFVKYLSSEKVENVHEM